MQGFQFPSNSGYKHEQPVINVLNIKKSWGSSCLNPWHKRKTVEGVVEKQCQHYKQKNEAYLQNAVKTPKYCFQGIRLAYIQRHVTSSVHNQWPTERHGAHPTHSYKQDGASKQTVRRQFPKCQVSTSPTLHGETWLALPRRTCQQLFFYRYKPPRIGEVANKTKTVGHSSLEKLASIKLEKIYFNDQKHRQIWSIKFQTLSRTKNYWHNFSGTSSTPFTIWIAPAHGVIPATVEIVTKTTKWQQPWTLRSDTESK